MLPELSEIKKARKRGGLTQKQLAELSRTSQSMIAKIEAGKAEPSYKNAKKIFDCMECLKEKSALKAKELMQEKVEFAEKDDNVLQTIKRMEILGISQMPVISGNTSIGTVSEKKTLKIYSENPERSMKNEQVFQIMEESLPIVGEETPFNILSELLSHNEGILIARKGKIKGIATKSDLLTAMLKKD